MRPICRVPLVQLLLAVVVTAGLSTGCDKSEGQSSPTSEATEAEKLDPPAQKTEIVWKTKAPDHDCSSPTPPHFDAGATRVIYFDCSVLTAYDRASGEKAWEMEVGGHQKGGPSAVIGDTNVYFERELGMNEHVFYAVDLESGEVNWKMQGAHGWGRPMVEGGKVYLPTWTRVMREASGKKVRGPLNVMVHKPTSGEKTGSFECGEGFVLRGDTAFCRRRLADDEKKESEEFTHMFVAYDVQSGERRWGRKTEHSGRLPSMLSATHAFHASRDGHTLVARDIKTGETSYTIKPKLAELNDPIPLGMTDTLAVAYEEKGASPVRLFGFDPASGDIEWEKEITTDMNLEGPRFDGKHILLLRAVEGDNVLQVFDADSGEVDWSLHFESAYNVPKIIDDRFYHGASIERTEYIVASRPVN